MLAATWYNPVVVNGRIDLEGTRQGDDIVQIGTRGGRPIKWSFSDITTRSFTWTGSILEADGVTWKTEVTIRARRTSE